MLRRDFVRVVVSLGLAPKWMFSQQASSAPPPPAPVPWTLGLNPATPLPHTRVADGIAQTDGRFFSAVQMATLVRLNDVLLPAMSDKPGAVQAETPVFLDFLIGASPAPRKKVYTDGLNWLEASARAKYRKPFAKVDDAEADAILKPWLRTWMSDHPPTEVHAGFVNIAHEDIRTATMNSKIWMDATQAGSRAQAGSLYWYPIDPIYAGAGDSLRAPLRVVDAPRAEHSIPAYPR